MFGDPPSVSACARLDAAALTATDEEDTVRSPVHLRTCAATLVTSTALAVAAMTALAAPAAAYGAVRTIGSSTSELDIASMSSEGNALAVAWLAGSTDLTYRVSTDKGRAFRPAVD